MVAQDLTKFTVVLVILGLILAIAIFRPQILPLANDDARNEPVPTEEANAGEPGREKDIAEQLAAIQAERDRLAAERDRLAREREALEAERERLEREQARLQEWKADLEERERKVQRLLRWSVAALVAAGLLAMPSVLVLVAWVRGGPRTPGGGARRDGASGEELRERPTQRGGVAQPPSARVRGGNGRGSQEEREPISVR